MTAVINKLQYDLEEFCMNLIGFEENQLVFEIGVFGIVMQNYQTEIILPHYVVFER